MALAGEIAGTVTALLRRFLTFIFGGEKRFLTPFHPQMHRGASRARATSLSTRPMRGLPWLLNGRRYKRPCRRHQRLPFELVLTIERSQTKLRNPIHPS